MRVLRMSKEKKLTYKDKHRVSSSRELTVFSYDFFSKEDAKSIGDRYLAGTNVDILWQMLNAVIKTCSDAYYIFHGSIPGKNDEMKLLDNLANNIDSLLIDLDILMHKYGLLAFIDTDLKYGDLQDLVIELQKSAPKINNARKFVLDSAGKKRGTSSGEPINELIRSLVLVYEKDTSIKAKDDFKQPKAQGLKYQGNFFDFCYEVFNIINHKMDQKFKSVKNIFYIDLDGISLGRRISKLLESPELEF